jgi:hypothetical protein
MDSNCTVSHDLPRKMVNGMIEALQEVSNVSMYWSSDGLDELK